MIASTAAIENAFPNPPPSLHTLLQEAVKRGLQTSQGETGAISLPKVKLKSPS